MPPGAQGPTPGFLALVIGQIATEINNAEAEWAERRCVPLAKAASGRYPRRLC